MSIIKKLFIKTGWTLSITLIRSYNCVVCHQASIIERMAEHPYQGEVPDQSNCDFSTYSHHEVIGGKLLVDRPYLSWEILPLFLTDRGENGAKHEPDGGICAICLKDNGIAALSTGGHIKFATPQDLEKTKRRY